MSLPPNQIKEPGKQSEPGKSLKEPSRESLPVNLLKEHSQESRILCPDPDIVSAPLRSGCSGCPERSTSNPVRFPRCIPFSAPYSLLVSHPRSPHAIPWEYSFAIVSKLLLGYLCIPVSGSTSLWQSLICLFLPWLSVF